MKNYIKVTGQAGQEVNYLRIDFDYSKGGYNYFTYRQEPRGYYISVVPVNKSISCGCAVESFVGFSGVKACLLQVARKSAKSEKEAAEIYEREKEKYITYIVEKYGLKIEED